MAKTMNKILGIEPIVVDEKITGTDLFQAASAAKNLPYKKGVLRLKADDVSQPVEVGATLMYHRKGIAAPDVRLDGKDLDLVTEQSILVQL